MDLKACLCLRDEDVRDEDVRDENCQQGAVLPPPPPGGGVPPWRRTLSADQRRTLAATVWVDSDGSGFGLASLRASRKPWWRWCAFRLIRTGSPKHPASCLNKSCCQSGSPDLLFCCLHDNNSKHKHAHPRNAGLQRVGRGRGDGFGGVGGACPADASADERPIRRFLIFSRLSERLQTNSKPRWRSRLAR